VLNPLGLWVGFLCFSFSLPVYSFFFYLFLLGSAHESLIKVSLSLISFSPLLGCFFIVFVPFAMLPGYSLVLKRVAFFTSCLSLVSVSLLSAFFDKKLAGFQFLYSVVDLPLLNLNCVLGLDGFGLVFVALTALLIPLCLLGFWNTFFFSKEFCISLLLLESLLFFTFFSIDLFFFYAFFESVLIPMFLIVTFWGGRSRKIRASYMLFFFTLLGSIVMFLGMLKLYLECGTLDVRALRFVIFEEDFQCMLWWPLFFAFGVKIPIFPFHVWLPEAHVEAPTCGSVLLAGVLLKLGVFGFIRFLVPIFPLASVYFSSYVFVMCSFGVAFCSLLAIRQSDLKRVIAYSSVAHMNLVVLGVFSLTFNGFEGAILQSLGHGFVSSALFFCIGMLYERFHTRSVARIGGLTLLMPVFNMFFFVFILSNIAVPGTSTFVGELFILSGLLKANVFACIAGCTGMLFGGCYSLFLYNRLACGMLTYNFFYGRLLNKLDVSFRETFILGTLFLGNLGLGLFPFFFTSFFHICCAELIVFCSR
jgi:NADH-quinone oxidoreductase subunit M